MAKKRREEPPPDLTKPGKKISFKVPRDKGGEILVAGAWQYEGAELELARELGSIAADLWNKGELRYDNERGFYATARNVEPRNTSTNKARRSGMQLQYGRPQATASFEALIEEMPEAEFAKLTRSTVPLLSWWSSPQRAEALFSLLGVHRPNVATFEYAVRAGCDGCGGRGKASFTDLMLEADDAIVAIEAKHSESVCEAVSSWLGDPPSANKQRVLKHWLECCLGVIMKPEATRTIVYQMIHRAASAVATAGPSRRAHVVHLLFGSTHAEDYVAASDRIAAALSSKANLMFSVIEFPMRRGQDYQRTASDLKSRGPEAVREALIAGSELFVFEKPVLLTR